MFFFIDKLTFLLQNNKNKNLDDLDQLYYIIVIFLLAYILLHPFFFWAIYQIINAITFI